MAGAITEGDEAGTNLDSLKAMAALAPTSITARYVRDGLGESRAVANLRIRHWAAQNGPEQA